MNLIPESPLPNIRPSRLQLLTVVASSFVILLGSASLFVWHLPFLPLVHIFPTDATMSYNAAWCFIFAGVGMYAATTRRDGVARVCGLGVALLGFLTLSEYLFGVDLGIDQALVFDHIETQDPLYERMALAAAIGFSLTGLSITLMSGGLWKETVPFYQTDVVALTGTILVILGLMTLLLLLTDMQVSYGWGTFSHSMAASSALGFFVLGVGMIGWAWHERRGTRGKLRALPFLVQAAGITITLLLWHALLVQEHRGIETTIAYTVTHIESEVIARMEARILALNRLAAQLGRMRPPVQEEWTANAETIVHDFPGFQAIAWVDTALRVRWVAPFAGNEVLLRAEIMNDPVRRALFEKVRDTRTVSISRIFDLAQGGRGFVVYVPVYQSEKFFGVIGGGFHAETLFATILHGIVPRYSFTIRAASEELYRRSLGDPEIEVEWGKEGMIELFNTRWTVGVWPEAATLAEARSLLPAWALGSGLIATTLLSIVVALAQESRHRARAGDVTNHELLLENSKRKEAEMEVRLLNSELEQRVRERTTDLERASADLRQLAYVSAHDLQEPVRMVSTYTQLLARRYQGKFDAEADQFINFTVEGASRIQALLADLLAYLQIDQNKTERREINCEEIFKTVLRDLKNMINTADAFVTHDPLPKVQANAAQLTLVFRNLLENALVFRLVRPPWVHVWAERRDDAWLFAVRDNGIGIAPQYAKQIFFMFERLHTQAEYPGTGMGLTLCYKIIEHHGGTIWVESEVGQGATFYFTIPHV